MAKKKVRMNKPGKCKDCLWWDSDGACNGVDEDWKKGVLEPQTFSVLIRASDDQGLSVTLVTGPDFGCVLFMAKEEWRVYLLDAHGNLVDDPQKREFPNPYLALEAGVSWYKNPTSAEVLRVHKIIAMRHEINHDLFSPDVVYFVRPIVRDEFDNAVIGPEEMSRSISPEKFMLHFLAAFCLAAFAALIVLSSLYFRGAH